MKQKAQASQEITHHENIDCDRRMNSNKLHQKQRERERERESVKQEKLQGKSQPERPAMEMSMKTRGLEVLIVAQSWLTLASLFAT